MKGIFTSSSRRTQAVKFGNLDCHMTLRLKLRLRTTSNLLGFGRVFASAFHKDTLLSARWYLGSTSNGAQEPWYTLLRVTPATQLLFLQRLLQVHERTLRKRTSKSQSCRLPLPKWDREVEIVTLLGSVHELMVKAVDPSGKSLFSKEALEDVSRRILEGSLWPSIQVGRHIQ